MEGVVAVARYTIPNALDPEETDIHFPQTISNAMFGHLPVFSSSRMLCIRVNGVRISRPHLSCRGLMTQDSNEPVPPKQKVQYTEGKIGVFGTL